MAPKASQQQSLTFLVTTNPNDANTAANKKRVRSLAALKSWPERRKRTFEQFVDAENAATAESSGEKSKARARQREKKTKEPAQIVFEEYERPTAPTPAPEAPLKHVRKKPPRAKTPERSGAHPNCHGEVALVKQTTRPPVVFPANSPCAPVALPNRLHDLLTPPPTPSTLSSASDLADPFNCYPVPHKPWFDRVLHHMMTVFAPRGWPALKITRQEGLRWEWFMTQHALSEPALFYVRLLFASGDMIRLGILDPEASYWLQDQAIKAINEALSNPRTAVSDALILAVGRIALHESMYGDRQAANTIHRPAQRRMIAMRGGLGALEIPELVKRLMRWSDRVMAMQGGTERFLEDEDGTTKDFSLNQSVSVSENWFGKDGSELRRKIKISDLVNDGDG